MEFGRVSGLAGDAGLEGDLQPGDGGTDHADVRRVRKSGRTGLTTAAFALIAKAGREAL